MNLGSDIKYHEDKARYFREKYKRLVKDGLGWMTYSRDMAEWHEAEAQRLREMEDAD